MIALLARRLVGGIVVLAIVVTAVFILLHAIPGDPARLLAGPAARPQDLEAVRRDYGLDRPLSQQYIRFATRIVHASRAETRTATHENCAKMAPLLHMDLGRSYRLRQPVVDIISARLPKTALLALAATVVQTLLAFGLALLSVAMRGRVVDRIVNGGSIAMTAVPTFLLGFALQYLFAVRLGWLPMDGYGQTAAETARALVLPALTLALYGAPYVIRVLRNELLEQLSLPHIRAVRARGAGRGRVLILYALRASLVPVVTLTGLELGALLGGAAITESVFRWPGLGQAAVQAAVNKDGPVVLGMVLVSATSVVVLSAFVDVAVALLDRRLRAAEREGALPDQTALPQL